MGNHGVAAARDRAGYNAGRRCGYQREDPAHPIHPRSKYPDCDRSSPRRVPRPGSPAGETVQSIPIRAAQSVERLTFGTMLRRMLSAAFFAG